MRRVDAILKSTENLTPLGVNRNTMNIKRTSVFKRRRESILNKIKNTKNSIQLAEAASIFGYSEFEKEILTAIFKIESTARPWQFRLSEVFSGLFAALFIGARGYRVVNSTVGPLQIGVKTSLNWSCTKITKASYIKRLVKLFYITGSCEEFINGLRIFLNNYTGSPSQFRNKLANFYNGEKEESANKISYCKALECVLVLNDETIENELRKYRIGRTSNSLSKNNILNNILTIENKLDHVIGGINSFSRQDHRVSSYNKF